MKTKAEPEPLASGFSCFHMALLHTYDSKSASFVKLISVPSVCHMSNQLLRGFDMCACAFISAGLEVRKKNSGTGGIAVGMSVCWRRVGTEVGRWRTEVVCGGIRWWCEGVTGFRSLLRNEKGQVGNMPLKVYEKNH